MMKTFFSWLIGFVVSNAQSVGTLIQTIFVVVGVLVANSQLAEMVDQNESVRNKEWFEYYKEYLANYQAPVEAVKSAAWRSRLLHESNVDMQKEFDEAHPEQTLNDYVLFLERMSDCGRFAVCSPKRVADFICAESKHALLPLIYHSKDIHLAAWTSDSIQRFSHKLDLLVANDCSNLDAIWFRIKYGLN